MSGQENCYLYLISEGDCGPVKVGISAKPAWRMYGLQSGNPRKLNLRMKWILAKRAHAKIIEQDLHAMLAERRMSGEWFDIPSATALEMIWTRLEERYGFCK